VDNSSRPRGGDTLVLALRDRALRSPEIGLIAALLVAITWMLV